MKEELDGFYEYFLNTLKLEHKEAPASVFFKNEKDQIINPTKPFPSLSLAQIQTKVADKTEKSFYFFKLQPVLSIIILLIILITAGLLYTFISSTTNFKIKKTYFLSSGKEISITKKNHETHITTGEASLLFQRNSKINFFLFPNSKITIKKKSLYLSKGRIVGEYSKKNDPQNSQYPIWIDGLKIQVIGTKFYIEKKPNQQTIVLVDKGHLQLTTKNEKTIDLLSKSYSTTSDNQIITGHFSKFFSIPLDMKQLPSVKAISNIQNFHLSSKSLIALSETSNTENTHCFYLDRFSQYKLNSQLKGEQWDIWHFNSIIHNPTIVRDQNRNKICRLQFRGTNSYSEAGIRAIGPFKQQYKKNNIKGIQIRIKGNLSQNNKLIIRIYEKDGDIFEHLFSLQETKALFNGQWHTLILPNTKLFWKANIIDKPSPRNFNNFSNLERFLIGITSKNDKKSHTLYFDDLCLIQKN